MSLKLAANNETAATELPPISDGAIADRASELLTFIRVGMMVLSLRVLTLLALVLGAGISTYAAISPDLYRCIVAVAWWPTVYWPALILERNLR